ncbi:type II secretion system protein GspM [Marinobacter sp.]|uniref:type II secretion system protein GspM n=1 Tax=Marinobacter sp. TaxID=50741 RepID=UPI003563DE6A
MISRIKDQPAVEKLIAQYDQLPRRDQQALMVLAIAVFLGILYFAIWRPAADFNDQSVAARDNAGELLAWMQANEPTIQRLGDAGGDSGAATADKPEDGRALMALVTRSAGEAGLSLQRFEPSGEAAIRVWLENAPFAEVASWLERLNGDHGVVIDQAAMDRSGEPGRVSVRLTLAI